jgi:hypothetical protein
MSGDGIGAEVLPMTTRPDTGVALAPLRCARCAVELRPGKGNFFRIAVEAVADPTPPEITAEELAQDVRPQIEALLARMNEWTEEELMEQVYRRLTFSLCDTCYRQWIQHPWA